MAGGSLHMTLNVCLDRSLHSWILSFGPSARVISPPHLADAIAEQIAEAHRLYEKTGVGPKESG
jgi:predicted DNA-binding transcriptional regulator YafY